MSFGDWLKSFASSGPVVNFEELPGGFAGTALIVAKMRIFALDALRDERVHQLAREITMGLAPRDRRGEAEALLSYLQPKGGRFRWTALPWSPKALQRLVRPPYLLFDAPTRSGECASLSTALASLLMAMGHEPRFRSVGRGDAPYDYEHVMVVDRLGDEWVALDPSFDYPGGWPFRPGDASQIRSFMDWLV